ncbi:hypothetical protein [Candidatus Protochlamydia phocaeensis]|uniref:hypothetical protein n=1 Tax=Candidatus Protochlamydia phocaeensis TaxID=1414722 RepID=UPI0008391429|nr:hypothetical protein [Candidatus Protochlamydia phocaeensis]
MSSIQSSLPATQTTTTAFQPETQFKSQTTKELKQQAGTLQAKVNQAVIDIQKGLNGAGLIDRADTAKAETLTLKKDISATVKLLDEKINKRASSFFSFIYKKEIADLRQQKNELLTANNELNVLGHQIYGTKVAHEKQWTGGLEAYKADGNLANLEKALGRYLEGTSQPSVRLLNDLVKELPTPEAKALLFKNYPDGISQAIKGYLEALPKEAGEKDLEPIMNLFKELKADSKEQVFFQALAKIEPGSKDKVANLLVAKGGSNALPIVNGMIRHEIDVHLSQLGEQKTEEAKKKFLEEKEGTLFRSNSLATKMLTQLHKREMTSYAQTHFSSCVQQLNGAQSCEVDPNKLQKGSIEENQKNLTRLTETMLSDITHAVSEHQLPDSIRDAYKNLYDALKEKWGAEIAEKHVMTTLFLRFICPALTSPSKDKGFGIIDGEHSKDGLRNAVLVTKIMQNLANNVQFGQKEEFMAAFANSMINEKNRDLIKGLVPHLIQ